MSSDGKKDKSQVVQLVEDIDAMLIEEVSKLWDSVVRVCNKTLNQANVFGFHLMHIPDPNITSVIQAIELQASPILQALIKQGYLSAEQEIKLINIETYLHLLQEIVVALKAGDREAFETAIEALSKEPMVTAS
ncbi:hypothetical protein ABMX69_20020 [Vibrio vulnificus]|uniref:hypothetical protein n=1 Tax=Vibrio vulnificus TaxID=672 RepID=UPI00102A3D4E|nr:hypothetical protein [Vibrio vulnificus]RZQ38629.1 hypothetical protein D8T41_15370 [Vibrio vulnificus]HDY7507903.1 hypothetical protein [Vibrio vulnificus]